MFRIITLAIKKISVKFPYSENFKLHQLANKISELALFLSEILSNLRKSEIDIMVANYRAAGIVKNGN